MRTVSKSAIEAAIHAWAPGVVLTSLSFKEKGGWIFASFSIEEEEFGLLLRLQEWEAKFHPLPDQEGEFRLCEPELQKEEFCSYDSCHICGGPSSLGVACQNCC